MRVPANAWFRGAILVLSCAVAGSMLTGLLIWRAHVTAGERAQTRAVIVQVCVRVHRLDVAIQELLTASSSKKALLRTAYYRDHPAELKAAVKQAAANAAILQRADCSASELSDRTP